MELPYNGYHLLLLTGKLWCGPLLWSTVNKLVMGSICSVDLIVVKLGSVAGE